MNQPTECKYCGCEEVATKTDSEIVFRCWSSYVIQDDYWNVSNNCGARCAVQVVEMRERIKRAVEALDDIAFGAWDEALQNATRILRGNSPESPDSSPITTADQLATADYFEAVRQRVPWMVAVEHIEGLVEGYRQCGVMVWRAAKHIEDLFGGEHGQTE